MEIFYLLEWLHNIVWHCLFINGTYYYRIVLLKNFNVLLYTVLFTGVEGGTVKYNAWSTLQTIYLQWRGILREQSCTHRGDTSYWEVSRPERPNQSLRSRFGRPTNNVWVISNSFAIKNRLKLAKNQLFTLLNYGKIKKKFGLREKKRISAMTPARLEAATSCFKVWRLTYWANLTYTV